jgi:hypothetical protein
MNTFHFACDNAPRQCQPSRRENEKKWEKYLCELGQECS